ncbi:MAG: hypothetical protein D6710_06475 [Nitrospirae bacterium]|nr:MAG: hypothetical protein D6710_06475 [Nitrospirota bacterium]
MAKDKQFYPDYLAEIVLTIFLVIEAVVVLALAFPQNIGRMINFTAPYQPRPEWYFLWLYQLVRYFHGRWIFLGTVILPLMIVLFIILLPWIEKRAGRKSVLFGSFLILTFFILFTLIPLFTQ